MGYSKVIKVNDHAVHIVHQLDYKGEAYAEDIMITTAENVDPHRLDYLANYDGKIGYANVSFSPASVSEQDNDIPFPS